MAGRNYQRKTSPKTSDLAMIWDAENSDWRLATLSDVKTLFEEGTTSTMFEPVTQYSSIVSGETLVIGQGLSDVSQDIHVIISNSVTAATGITIQFPIKQLLRDKQTVLISTARSLSTISYDGNGAAIEGQPPSVAQWGFAKWKYDALTETWYLIG